MAAVCAISLWEIARLAERGRLQLNATVDELLEAIEANPFFEIAPLSGRVAALSTRLSPACHEDPGDQILVAPARCHGVRLMTRDDQTRSSGGVALL